MLLLAHIAIALMSVGLAGLTLISPSKKKLNASYSLVAATFVTGTILVILSPSHLVTACISGLIYLGFISVGIFTARYKLSRASE